MRFYLLNPISVPPNPHLFPMFVDEWQRHGIDMVNRIEDCEVVLFDLHTRISDYKQEDIDFIIDSQLKVATFDEWDRGGMSKDVWPNPLTPQLEVFWFQMRVFNLKTIHFSRLLNKTHTYPPIVFPFEKPILFEQPMVSADDLFNRSFDIVWIANTAPQRERLKQILEADGRLKCDIRLGQEKLPLERWIDEHRKGKLFVSWSAGGFGDEKIQHLFSVAGIIKENNDQLFANDFVHLETAIRPNPIPTKEDLDTIYEIVNDKERLYRLYKNGYEFMKQYYSKEAIANYILTKIKENLYA